MDATLFVVVAVAVTAVWPVIRTIRVLADRQKEIEKEVENRHGWQCSRTPEKQLSLELAVSWLWPLAAFVAAMVMVTMGPVQSASLIYIVWLTSFVFLFGGRKLSACPEGHTTFKYLRRPYIQFCSVCRLSEYGRHVPRPYRRSRKGSRRGA